MRLLVGFLVCFVIFTSYSGTQSTLDNAPVSTVIKTADSTSNFEALLQSNELNFLRRMDPNYDTQLPGFWKKCDTTKLNVRKMRIFRIGACKDTLQTQLTYENCVQHEYLTINVFKKKVVQYSVDGKEFSAIIEFVYNKKGKLVRYVENGNPSKLSYGDDGKLTTVTCYVMENGKQKLKRSITFK
ncbi:MAG: hypothetical protein ACJAZ2_001639 [Glaciecola sp.]|jgi:hypothetical protein